MVEEDNNNDQSSMEHTKADEWVPRIAGVITLISSLCMIWMAWSRRRRLFHRLILGKIYLVQIQTIMIWYYHNLKNIVCAEKSKS